MDMVLFPQQRQQLSQAQIQSLSILAMDQAELLQFLQNEYMENPLLDYDPLPVLPSYDDPEFHSACRKSERYEFEWTERGKRDREEYESYDREISAPKGNEVQEYVLSQLNPKEYSAEEWSVFSYLIDCLDDNGFFTMPIEEAANQTGHTAEFINRCLQTLKQLEPYGIFASDLAECLLLQLRARGQDSDVMTHMLRGHLQDIAEGKMNRIAKSLRLSVDEVRRNIGKITCLNPRPLSGFGSESSQFIIPDVLFERDEAGWSIHLNDSWISGYHRNDCYKELMRQTADKELGLYLHEKEARINLIFSSIQQRRTTIRSVSQVILEHQRLFFDKGGELRPMTLGDVALKAGVHVSTVSRAVRGKFLQYPNGSIAIKNLFVNAASPQHSEMVTPMAVKRQIKEYINSEDSRKPYSDQQLVGLLAAGGIQVSRRAVAKYREELGICGSFGRRTE